jgi:hypothetical protein
MRALAGHTTGFGAGEIASDPGCNWYTQAVSSARRVSEIIQVLQWLLVKVAPSCREPQRNLHEIRSNDSLEQSTGCIDPPFQP